MLFCLAGRAVDSGSLVLKTVVIDAGHGGKDPGCVSSDKKTREKTLTLDISKKLADRITSAYPDVKVVLTRPDDKYVALDNRATIANKSDADLFISIHINASPKTGPNGYSVHVLGQSSHKDRDLFAYNRDVCLRENSVVKLDEEDGAGTMGFDPTDPESMIFLQLMQNAHLEQSLLFAQYVSDNLKGGPIKKNNGIWQDPFYVLWKTSMPAVLVELGFMSNQADLAMLRQDSKRDDIVERLFKAFVAYKSQYDRSVSLPPAPELVSPVPELVSPVPEPVSSVPEPVEGPTHQYGIQIFAVSKIIPPTDPSFLGYTPTVIKVGSLRKYIIGVSETPEKARSEHAQIKKKYPESFLVKITGDQLERIR